MSIPHFTLAPAAAELQDELLARWGSILARTAFVGGPEVESFESAFAAYLDAPGCVGVANGTDALVLALHALGLQPGDEVLVPAMTFFATAEAVAWAGGVPVPVDVDAGTITIDAAHAESVATARTVGIIGVHLYGHPFDLDAVGELCRRRGWWLIEDSAQAHGATWNGRKIGSSGQLSAWSFYPSKNLGAFGDGGAVTGGDRAALARARLLANHGRLQHYEHGAIGTNSRLDGLQAAVLNLRLPLLDRDNARRRAIAARYRAQLAGLGDLRLLDVAPQAEPVYHQLVVRTARRDALRQHLQERQIGSAVFYPIPLHRQPALATIMQGASLPASEQAAAEVLALPCYPQLADAQVDEVCAAVRDFFAG